MSDTTSAAAAAKPTTAMVNERLSLPLPIRLPVSMTLGAASGFFLGAAKGSSDAGYRYQAENAHRLPTTQIGWYLYHKSKNYNMMLGGVKEGFKQAWKLSLWVGLYFVLEEGVDRGRAAAARQYAQVRHHRTSRRVKDPEPFPSLSVENQVASSRDFISSMLAGLGTAGLFSAWNRFPISTAARTAKMGAKAGLAFGLLQDCVSVLRGRRVTYVDFVKNRVMGSSSTADHV